MKKENQLLATAAVAAAVIMSVLWLSPAPSVKAGVPAPTLRIASPYTLGTLNPFRFMADYDYQIISQVYEPLVTFDARGRAVPALASSWKVLDGRTWEFHLREKARWTGGNEVFEKPSPVTSNDVAVTFRLLVDPRTRATFQSYWAAQVSDVKVIDSRTIRVTTRQPSAFFLDLIGHIPIVSERVVARFGVDGLDQHIVGSGPFKWVSTGADGSVTLAANGAYTVRPQVERVVFRTIVDKSVAAMALENGDIDISMQLPPQEISRLGGLKTIRIIQAPTGSYRYAALNQRKPLFSDPRLRQAISAAIDEASIAGAIFPSPRLGRPAWGPVPPGITGNDPGLKSRWTHDLAAARRQLAALGWTDSDQDGLVEKSGDHLVISIYAPSDPNRSKFAVILADQLRAAGVDARTKIQEWGIHLQDVKSGQADMFIMGGGNSADGLLYLFHSRFVTPDHDTGYRNPRLDEVLDRAAAQTNPADRAALWRQAQKMVVNDRVHIAGYYEFVNAGVRSNVRGFIPPGYTLHLADRAASVSLGASE